MEFPGEGMRRTESAATVVIEIQAPEGAQLVLDIAQALGQVERLGEGGAHLGSLGRRGAERGV